MTDVVVCSAAEREYTESLCWYAERSEAAAQDFDAEFDRVLSEIAAAPERYPACDSRHRFYMMRRFPFRVIYRLDGDEIVIIAVAHNSRAPSYWSDR